MRGPQHEAIAVHHSTDSPALSPAHSPHDRGKAHARFDQNGRRSNKTGQTRRHGSSHASPDVHSPSLRPELYQSNEGGEYGSPGEGGGGALPGFFPPPSHQVYPSL